MKNKTIMKIISICFIFIVIFSITGNVFAAVNSKYGTNEPVVEDYLEEKMQNSTLLEAIASLIYAVGSFVESIVGSAFQLLTGQNMFPWADKVIFNTIPFLDVNFLNPSSGSLFLTTTGNDTALATIVRNMYFSVLVIAIGFLGIVVGLMAIRLAFASIAAEKAKYKQAITKFLVSLVMLFCVHYIISLVFYINESMVEIASEILIDSIKESGVTINAEFFSTTLNDKELVENFFEKQETLFGNVKFDNFEKEKNSILENEEKVAIAAYLLKSETYKKLAIPEAHGNSEEETWNGWFWNWRDNNNAVSRLVNDINAIQDDGIMIPIKVKVKLYNEIGADAYIQADGKNDYAIYYEKEFQEFFAQNGSLVYYNEDEARKVWIDENGEYRKEEQWKHVGLGTQVGEAVTREEYKSKVLVYEMQLNQLFINASSKASRNTETSPESLIADMGQYFKENAWTYETDEDGNETGWDADSLTIQGALLYSIFVIQSMLYFFAYIRRFFFVVILAMLAPVIVVYDFLGKAIA